MSVFGGPIENAKLRVLSLGAGVQSTTLALMAAHGEIGPMPDCAIFADTQAEPVAVYEHLRWLMGANVLPYPVHVVTAGSIVDDLVSMLRGERWASIPAYVMGNDGRAAPITRQCTKEYKLEPIHAKVRALVGLAPGRSFRHAWGLGPHSPVERIVEQWIGISADEVQRAKDSEHEWVQNRWPLLEIGMKRQDCIKWLEAHEYPVPPKSACVFCPYTENQRWRQMRDTQPAEIRAVAIDKMIAPGAPSTATRTGTKPMHLHRSLLRLDEVDLTDLFYDAGGMGNECEGMCGV